MGILRWYKRMFTKDTTKFTLRDMITEKEVTGFYDRGVMGENLSTAVGRTAPKLGYNGITAWNTIGHTDKTIDLHGLGIDGSVLASLRIIL